MHTKKRIPHEQWQLGSNGFSLTKNVFYPHMEVIMPAWRRERGGGQEASFAVSSFPSCLRVGLLGTPSSDSVITFSAYRGLRVRFSFLQSIKKYKFSTFAISFMMYAPLLLLRECINTPINKYSSGTLSQPDYQLPCLCILP